ncbi:MAG TPA: hypothetical protein PK400_05530 [Phycisphaerales bacterium]|nr:hypothetical protein [Phycisphaerales bacterium]HRQ75961.1 hypothetical protein [Phycisphaerales bacterium]
MARRKRRRKGVRGMAALLHDRFMQLAILTTLLGLFAFILCLELIGPPPRWRIDALWVNQHSRTVRVMAYALVIAGGASAVLLLARRPRAIMLVTWIAAVIVCIALYRDRIPIIFDVVRRYAM